MRWMERISSHLPLPANAPKTVRTVSTSSTIGSSNFALRIGIASVCHPLRLAANPAGFAVRMSVCQTSPRWAVVRENQRGSSKSPPG